MTRPDRHIFLGRLREFNGGGPALALAGAALLARVLFGVLGLEGGLGAGLGGDEDAADYHTLSASLAERGSYAFDASRRWGTEATAWRPPGYPFLLAGVYALFGPFPAAARIAQAVLGALSVLLLFHAGRRGLSPGTALVAALLVALDPFLVHLSNRVLTESWFVFLLALSFALLARAGERGGAGWLAGAALALAWASLTRPAAFAALLAMPLWLWRTFRGRLAPQGIAGRAALVVAVGLLPVVGWALRNVRAVGAPVLFSTNGGETFYGANNGLVLADPVYHGYWVPTKRLPGVLEEAPPATEEVARDRWKWRRGWQFLREHPGDIPVLLARKAARYWSPLLRSGGVEGVASLLGYGLLLPFIAWGLLRTLGAAWREGGLLLAAHLLLWSNFATALVFWGAPRFRAATAPCLALFAAAGLASAARAVRGLARARARAPG